MESLLILHFHFKGLVLGLLAFIMIGLFHLLVIKAEYYWGTKFWRIFLGISIISTLVSIIVSNFFVSALCGILAFVSFWGIFEMFKQAKRVKKGWFPENLKRKN